jgi:hypothetical protein
MVFLSVCMAGYAIYYILGVDKRESHGTDDTTKVTSNFTK